MTILISYILVVCMLGIHFYYHLDNKNGLLFILNLFLVFMLVSVLQTALYLHFFTESKELHRASPLGFIYGPFVFFAFYAMEKDAAIPKRYFWRHLAPFFLWLPLYIYFVLNEQFRQDYSVIYYIILYLSVFISGLFYSIYCFSRLVRLSGLSQTSVTVLSVSVILLLVYSLYLLLLVYNVHLKQKTLSGNSSLAFIVMMRGLAVSLAFYKIFKSLIAENENKEIYGTEEADRYVISNHEKYINSQLPVGVVRDYIKRFEDLMYNQKYYLQPNLSLEKISDKLKIPTHHLTQMLSRAYGIGVLELINRMRVEYACDLMRQHPQQPLNEIIESSGFASESTFFRNFKAIKNLTPSQYRESLFSNQ